MASNLIGWLVALLIVGTPIVLVVNWAMALCADCGHTRNDHVHMFGGPNCLGCWPRVKNHSFAKAPRNESTWKQIVLKKYPTTYEGSISTSIYVEKYLRDPDGRIGTDWKDAAFRVYPEEAAELIEAMHKAEDAPGKMRAWSMAIDAAKKFTPPDYRAMTIFTEVRDEQLKALKKVSK